MSHVKNYHTIFAASLLLLLAVIQPSHALPPVSSSRNVDHVENYVVKEQFFKDLEAKMRHPKNQLGLSSPYHTSETAAQSETEVLDNLSDHTVIMDADVLLVTALGKINNLFQQKYNKVGSKILREWTSPPVNVTHPIPYYVRAYLHLSAPGFVFGIDNELHMVMRLTNKSEIVYYNTDGKVISSTHLANSSLVHTQVSLTIVSGEKDDSLIAINVKDTYWDVSMTLADGSALDPSAVAQYEHALKEYFKSTFTDKDYVLGGVYINPNSPSELAALKPKSFQMRVFRDVQDQSSGHGYLAVAIGCNDRMISQNVFDSYPKDFNLVPDGSDMAMFIPSWNFYNSVLRDVVKDQFSGYGAQNASSQAGTPYSYGTCSMTLPSYPSETECEIWEFPKYWCGQMKDITVTRSISADIKKNIIKGNHDSVLPIKLTSGSSDIEFQFCWCRESCTDDCGTTKRQTPYTVEVSLTFSVSESLPNQITVTSSKPSYDYDHRILEHSFWDEILQNKVQEIIDTFTSWQQDSMYIEDLYLRPVSKSISTFSVDHVLIPEQNIFKYKNIYMVNDLVVFGSIVESLN
eukprot:Nk52_evm14s165 gene=Nk52_evmTU14s165